MIGKFIVDVLMGTIVTSFGIGCLIALLIVLCSLAIKLRLISAEILQFDASDIILFYIITCFGSGIVYALLNF